MSLQCDNLVYIYSLIILTSVWTTLYSILCKVCVIHESFFPYIVFPLIFLINDGSMFEPIRIAKHLNFVAWRNSYMSHRSLEFVGQTESNVRGRSCRGRWLMAGSSSYKIAVGQLVGVSVCGTLKQMTLVLPKGIRVPSQAGRTAGQAPSSNDWTHKHFHFNTNAFERKLSRFKAIFFDWKGPHYLKGTHNYSNWRLLVKKTVQQKQSYYYISSSCFFLEKVMLQFPGIILFN